MPKKYAAPSPRLVLLLLGFCLGLLVSAGGGSAIEQIGGRTFCGSCHVMHEAAWTHAQSAHARQACNECHAPQTFAIAHQARSTLYYTMANYFMDVPDVIRAGARTKDIIKNNCLRCHYETVREVNMGLKPYCTDCHRSVPHRGKLPLEQRTASDV